MTLSLAIGTAVLLIGTVVSSPGGIPVEVREPAVSRQVSDELPDGDGKKILQTSCTACHDLTEVTKFKGFYTRDDWRDVVKTMIEYGAKVKPEDVDVLVDYLAKNLGKK